MSEAAKKSLQAWIGILLTVGLSMLGGAKLAGANEAKAEAADREHDRRIQLLEDKFERYLEKQSIMAESQAVMAERQAVMASDLKIIREFIQSRP